ncbi:clusterin-like protein 1 [Megalops cyprinoides]|uniref:clusterin-like protein 1 n=1 Tax=Megalops cyprinoides TaxID=118141 RepID=UPI001864340B|nr:clusterin-like protein 1 [Megalops cyprinoides]
MRAALLCLALLVSLGVLQAAPEKHPVALSEDALKELSQEGERYVGEEMKRALMGVKQMKELMERNGEKHEHLMKTLMHSGEKKKGAQELAQEVEQKLGEAEQHCQQSLKASWEECRPCLEEACKTFYTSTCRRGFSSFSDKVEQFFRRMASRGSQDLLMSQSPDSPDRQVQQVEDSFNELLHKVNDVYTKSVVLVVKMQQEFDQAFREIFAPETKADGGRPRPSSAEDTDSSFFQGIGLDDVLDSFFDFGKTVFQEFSSVVTQVFDDIHESIKESKVEKEKEQFPRVLPSQSRKLCRDLRRQTSECWQLSSQCDSCKGTLLEDCPSVRELQVELNEVSQLLQTSSQQYEEVLQIVQRHTEDTVTWLSNMASNFGWVAEVAINSTAEPEIIFNISAVLPHAVEGYDGSAADSKVEVNILDSPRMTLNVPAELEVEDPAFVQYVAQEALGRYKLLLRQDDP